MLFKRRGHRDTENFLAKRFALAGLLLAATISGLADWPQFRGPLGNGHMPDGSKLPSVWGEEKNVAWKIALPGRAWSSPVVWGDKVWLTTADEKGHKLTGLCVDANSGKIIFEKQLFSVAKPQYAHKFNSYASPTPVVEKDRVYLTWGSPGTACLDTKINEVLWARDDFVCDHFRGAGSSPRWTSAPAKPSGAPGAALTIRISTRTANHSATAICAKATPRRTSSGTTESCN